MKLTIKKTLPALLMAAVMMLSACGGSASPASTFYPHEGMVEVRTGIGDNTIWVREYEDLPVNDLDPARFYQNAGLIGYSGTDYRAAKGIDVSEHQNEIDFEAVKASGIEYVIIRAGYRGCTEGGLNRDKYFKSNIEAAAAAGLDVGIYFFSQSITVQEAEEEAEFLTELLSVCSENISLPVFYDWETVDIAGARTDGVLAKGLTEMAEAFCAKVKAAGFTPGVYAGRTVAYYNYDLQSLSDEGITLWISAVGDTPDFYYAHEFWQYSVSGTVDGIEGEVDLDLRFISAESLGITDSELPSPVSEKAAEN